MFIHHYIRIVFNRWSLQILILKIYYPLPYERDVFHYKKANVDLIRWAICEFNREKAFDNKNINEKVSIFINTINNFLSNFIPHEIITCDDRNPPWFINEIEKLKKKKIVLYKLYLTSDRNTTKLETIKSL